MRVYIFLRFFRYDIYCSNGYQKFEEGLSSVTTEVKGIAYTNLSLHFPIKSKNKTVYNQGPQIWDSADYVTPAEVRYMIVTEIHGYTEGSQMCPNLFIALLIQFTSNEFDDRV